MKSRNLTRSGTPEENWERAERELRDADASLSLDT
jgi:hypothetical protein